MKILLLWIIVSALACSAAPTPPPIIYDAGVSTCQDAARAVRGCPAFELDAGDTFLTWCQEFTADGVYTIDLACIANAETCAAAETCLEH